LIKKLHALPLDRLRKEAKNLQRKTLNQTGGKERRAYLSWDLVYDQQLNRKGSEMLLQAHGPLWKASKRAQVEPMTTLVGTYKKLSYISFKPTAQQTNISSVI
jgi:hypothetical protein